MLNVVCFKWGEKYSSKHVNLLYKQVKEHLHVDFKFHCITDKSSLLDNNIQIYPFWGELKEIQNSVYTKGPLNNYKRLKLYDRSILKQFDYNVLMLDIDMIICNDITFLANLNRNSMWYSPTSGRNKFTLNTSVTRVVNDDFCKVWDQFIKSPFEIIKKTRKEGWKGTDQSILTYFLKDKINYLTKNDGIVSLRDDIEIFKKYSNQIPEWIRIIAFYGEKETGDPADKYVQKIYPWIKTVWKD